MKGPLLLKQTSPVARHMTRSLTVGRAEGSWGTKTNAGSCTGLVGTTRTRGGGGLGAAGSILTSAATGHSAPLTLPWRLLSTCARYETKAAGEPFYGHPRPAEEVEEGDYSYRDGSDDGEADSITSVRTALGRAKLLFEQSAIALRDPTRADAVAAVGELTGPVALRALLGHMRADPTGQRILQDRPIVSKDTIPYDSLIASAARSSDAMTFGQAYGTYLASHGFDPDGRDPIRYVEDPDLAYVMLRYRQCHDFWHALTGLPPTVAGELGLKWLELFQTGLPLPALSSAVASYVLQLGPSERRGVWDVYLPWAYHTSKRMAFGSLLSVYYEEEFDTPLDELRNRLKLQAAPVVS